MVVGRPDIEEGYRDKLRQETSMLDLNTETQKHRDAQRTLRKVTKSKSVFPSYQALFKMLYLAINDITEKGPIETVKQTV